MQVQCHGTPLTSRGSAVQRATHRAFTDRAINGLLLVHSYCHLRYQQVRLCLKWVDRYNKGRRVVSVASILLVLLPYRLHLLPPPPRSPTVDSLGPCQDEVLPHQRVAGCYQCFGKATGGKTGQASSSSARGRSLQQCREARDHIWLGHL